MPKKIRGEHRYTLDQLRELGAISPSESYWWEHVCTTADLILDRLSEDANNSIATRDHWLHLRAYERAISDYAFEAIPNSRDPLACYLRDFQFFDDAVRCVSDMDAESHAQYAGRLLRSFRRSAEVVLKSDDDSIRRVINMWAEQARKREAELRAIAADLHRTVEDIWARFFGNERQTKPTKQRRKFVRGARSAFVRSYSLAKMILGPDRLAAVMRDKAMEVAGQLYRYRVTLKAQSLLATGGHGQTVTTVMTLGGEEICDLCLYSKNCTILDHVISIFVHATSGEELNILETGNVFNIRDVVKFKDDVTFISGSELLANLPTPEINPEIRATIDRQADESKRQLNANRDAFMARIDFDLNAIRERLKGTEEPVIHVNWGPPALTE